MRMPLKDLHDTTFDAIVVGAGVNGASAAQHLAAEGYSVLLVEKGDFASGSSSRSSRLLHCGLRYLAPGSSMFEFVKHPKRLAVACRMARQAMQCRSQFVNETPQRVRPLTFAFPIYRDGPYKSWQVDLAFKILRALGPKDVPLDYKRLERSEILKTPLLQHLRSPDTLSGAATFREYRFDWPERIVVDTVLDAERIGAVIRNYTAVSDLRHDGENWRVQLSDTGDSAGDAVTVSARLLFNMAGIWIDNVNGLGDRPAKRKITGTKGVHIAVRLPPECQEFGIATINRLNEPFYCVPWRGLHYFGPTETLYEGDIDDIKPTEAEIEGLIDEANWLLPALALKREDVYFSWAGVRPLTYDPDQPMGARSRELHSLASEGMPNAFAMTAGPIMTHRSAGEEVAREAQKHMAPSGQRRELSYASPEFPRDATSPAVVNHDSTIRMEDVRHAARVEQPRTLADIMFRRVGLGWSETMGREGAQHVAEAVSDILDWDEGRIEKEVDDYLRLLERQHSIAPSRSS